MNSVSSRSTSAAPANVLFLTRAAWFWLAAFVLLSAGARGVLRHYSIPLPLQVTVALVPLLGLGGFMLVQRKEASARDELERHIQRETAGIALYVVFGVFVAVDLLKSGGLLLDFNLTARTLGLAMLASIGFGWVCTARRYR